MTGSAYCEPPSVAGLLAARVCADVVAGSGRGWSQREPGRARGGGHCTPRFVGCGGQVTGQAGAWASVGAATFTS